MPCSTAPAPPAPSDAQDTVAAARRGVESPVPLPPRGGSGRACGESRIDSPNGQRDRHRRGRRRLQHRLPPRPARHARRRRAGAGNGRQRHDEQGRRRDPGPVRHRARDPLLARGAARARDVQGRVRGATPASSGSATCSSISKAADLRGFETRIALQRRLGVDVRVITPKEAQAIVPALHVDDLVAAVWGPQDGVAGPAEVTAGFARRARELGARIVEGVETTGLTLEAGRIRGVTTTDGAIAAPVVVNAAGPAAARVGRLAGLDAAGVPASAPHLLHGAVPGHPRARADHDRHGERVLLPQGDAAAPPEPRRRPGHRGRPGRARRLEHDGRGGDEGGPPRAR